MPIIHLGRLAESPFMLPAILIAYVLMIIAAIAITSVRARRLAVITAVIAANGAIAIALGATLSKADARFAVERVPGGVAAIVWSGETSKPDLIITGLSRQSYSLDECVLQPMLRRYGTEKLSRLILLNADYSALKDILRLSLKLGVDTVYVGRDLAASASDIRNGMGDSTLEAPVILFGGQASAPDQSGYSLSQDRMTLRLNGTQLDIVDQVRFESLMSSAVPPGSTLVIGSQWHPSADDWIRLTQAGYERIVCAKIEQPTEAVWPDAELNLDALPDYLFDLSRSGPLTLPLSR